MESEKFSLGEHFTSYDDLQKKWKSMERKILWTYE